MKLALVGELDLASAPSLADYLRSLKARGRRVSLDLSGLDFVDSAGARAITHPSGAHEEEWLQIDRGLSPQLERLIQLSKRSDTLEAT